jgi:hypothetical protein
MAIGTPYLVCQASYASGSATETTQVGTGGGAASNNGDTLVAWLTSNASTGTITSVSDSVNGTWLPAGSESDGSSVHGRWFIMPNAGALSLSQGIGGVWSGTGGGKTIQVYGIPGLNIAGDIDASVVNNGSSVTTGTASGTLRSSNEIVLCGESNSTAGGSGTWSAPFTAASASVQAPSGQYSTCSYDIVSATTSVTATATITSTHWVTSLISIPAPGLALPTDAAGAVDSFVGVNQVAEADVAGAVDTFAATQIKPVADVAGAVEAIVPGAAVPEHDAAGAVDAIAVSTSVTITFTPAANAATAVPDLAVEYVPGVPVYYPPASPAFIKSQMPRFHVQNLLTGQWLHRDIQNVTQPSVTWQLNGAGNFTCTLSPPRADLLDATGNPIFQVWQTAGYLEESDEIKFGGICTSATPQGPNLPLTFTEFSGYPNGMPYEGPNVSQSGIDALDAVRNIWAWLQSMTGGNLGLVLDTTKAGVQLGVTSTYSTSTVLSKSANKGDNVIHIVQLPLGSGGSGNWKAKAALVVGTSTTTVKSATATTITLGSNLSDDQPAGSLVALVQPAIPYTLDWWNSTDCGQEISTIQQEAPFDFREVHTWTDANKDAVSHRLAFGVPRLGSRRTDLRFAEGENIVSAGQVTQDGSTFANNITGIGAGTGSGGVRSSASLADGRIRRVNVYVDQTITRQDRLQSRINKVLTATDQVDTISQIVVKNHSNAAFGTFVPGDDIPVQLATGWRKILIWSRILNMQQDPTTQLMTIGLARSDSFAYVAQSGSAGQV